MNYYIESPNIPSVAPSLTVLLARLGTMGHYDGEATMQKQESRLYSIGEAYQALVVLFRSIRHVRKAKKKGLIDRLFMERIMLAVTQVNVCPLCSYAHTRMALEMGMASQDIKQLLSGELEQVPDDQLKAIMFSQHYAETKGRPTRKAWDEIVLEYGDCAAKGILGSARIIMVGNIWGVVLGLLQRRISDHSKDTRSSLGYELLLTFSILPFLPLAALHSIVASLVGTPLLRFSGE
ncbi:carboxymuconolactone decarboxylase family protein [Sphaerochaeta sp. PS]|uniref:carboxymuconolactone decarboxylase family protein n=1 Tax=Sphaerochaeta sp. PS TaxID=3076336 RepID=UPI0028A30161|nr:carboxymuconolactone decarboxylase family protein [Sphaerochaeta sp. PS]MDT4763403.1 carboxymuconolactone decarboxylase family protein [Sphaerochaeta sp. PS]